MLKFLHVSDLHLNAGFANKSEKVRARLKESLKMAFEKAVAYTLHQELEGMLIAGDLFDHEPISYEDERWLKLQLNKVLDNDQKIIYVTGNHDPMNTLPFLESLNHKHNLIKFESDQIKVMPLMSKKQIAYNLVGVGHQSKNEQRNLIQHFPMKNDDAIWIGIAHASVPSAQSVENKRDYMAVSLGQIENLNYDYFALGHIHIRQMCSNKVAYSGNIQGLNVKETGNKGGYLVSVEKQQTFVEPVDFNAILWEQETLLITPETETINELEHQIREQISMVLTRCNCAANNLILRMHVKGYSSVKKKIQDVQYLQDKLKDQTGVLDLELKMANLKVPRDILALTSEKTVLAEILQRIQNNEFEDELLEKILSLKIFDFDKTQLKAVLQKDLKEALLDEAIERMVVDDYDH